MTDFFFGGEACNVLMGDGSRERCGKSNVTFFFYILVLQDFACMKYEMA